MTAPGTPGRRTLLGGMPGLTVTGPAGTFGPQPAFAVRGEVALRDSRLVITTRLYQRGQDAAVWTSTFWRTDHMSSDLVSDLSAAVAEAVFGHVARDAATTAGSRP